LACEHVIVFFKIGSCQNKTQCTFQLQNERVKSVSFNAEKYATEVGVLRREFKSRFRDFWKHETSFRISASPSEVNVEAVPEKFQMELINLHSRESMKSKYITVSLLKYCKLYLPKNNSLRSSDTTYV
jgi:hypothetical protein